MKTSLLTFQKMHGRARGTIGSSIIRGEWIVNHWPEAELWTNGQYSDAIIYQKAYFIYHMQDYKGLKILDLCDPDWLKGEAKIAEMIDLIDVITCSTEALTNVIKNFTDKPVITIPDRLDLDEFPKDKKIHKGKAKKVCWFGYLHNAEKVLNFILPQLAELGLSLTVISNKDYYPLNSFGVEIINIDWDWDNAYTHIRDCDIALNPHLMTTSFKYKSNNKSLIAWALGVPVATDDDELVKFMDSDNRNKEIDIRTKEVKEKYDVKLSVEQFKQLINKYGKKHK